jgi:hypothetical protein
MYAEQMSRYGSCTLVEGFGVPAERAQRAKI